MHHPALRVVEGIAAMHGAAVVPENEVADAPVVLVAESRLRGVLPKLVQQFCRAVGIVTLDIGIPTPSEIQHLFAGFGVDAERWMPSAGSLVRIVGRNDALAQEAAGIVGPV